MEHNEPDYSIDLSWYEKEGRSFLVLASSRLCPSCREKGMPASEEDLFQTFKKCCSQQEDFINPSLPLLEIIFRLFLANSNQPLDLEQIQQQLQIRLGNGSIRDISLPKLMRILDSDHYYGLRAVPQATEASASPQSL